MSSRPDLKLDWCSHPAAKCAVEHWHYSRSMPASKTVKLGIWEDSRFIGAIIFSLGANRHLASPFGLTDTQVCELTRVALAAHANPVSRMLAIAVMMLKSQSPRLRLVVSYANTAHGHYGGIYQAAGWLYLGESLDSTQRLHGRFIHRRSVYSRYGRQDIGWLREHVDPTASWVPMPPKHKYAMPLNAEIKLRLSSLVKAYPKRVKDSSEPPGILPGEGGAAPTRTLQKFF